MAEEMPQKAEKQEDDDLKSDYIRMQNAQTMFWKRLCERMHELDERELRWKILYTKIDESISKTKQRVKLNVGGTIFEISKSSLLSVKDSYFHAMIGSGEMAT